MLCVTSIPISKQWSFTAFATTHAFELWPIRLGSSTKVFLITCRWLLRLWFRQHETGRGSWRLWRGCSSLLRCSQCSNQWHQPTASIQNIISISGLRQNDGSLGVQQSQHEPQKDASQQAACCLETTECEWEVSRKKPTTLAYLRLNAHDARCSSQSILIKRTATTFDRNIFHIFYGNPLSNGP